MAFEFYKTVTVVVPAQQGGGPVSAVIAESNFYRSFVVQILGFDNAAVFDVLVSLDGTNYTKLAADPINTAAVMVDTAVARAIAVSLPCNCAGGLKVQAQVNQAAGGTILVAMTDTPMNHARSAFA